MEIESINVSITDNSSGMVGVADVIAKQSDYYLYIIHFKEYKRKNKIKRQIHKVEYYDNITLFLASYLAYKTGCALRFLDDKGDVTTPATAIRMIGYDYFDKKICFANNNSEIKYFDYDLSIYPKIKSVTLSNKMLDFDKIEDLIAKYNDNFFDYSIDASNIWGPTELIPDGFIHVTEGVVTEGDYYWDKDHFIKCSVSFSPIKIGQKIEIRGWKYCGKHNGRIEDEVTNYYNQFIIRKN